MSDLIPDEERAERVREYLAKRREVTPMIDGEQFDTIHDIDFGSGGHVKLLASDLEVLTRRPSLLTREALEEVVGLLASYGEYVEVEVAIEYVRSLSRFSLPEPAEHIVPCARCGQKRVIASDAENSEMEVCGDCGIAVGREVEPAEVEWEYGVLFPEFRTEPSFVGLEEGARYFMGRPADAVDKYATDADKRVMVRRVKAGLWVPVEKGEEQ